MHKNILESLSKRAAEPTISKGPSTNGKRRTKPLGHRFKKTLSLEYDREHGSSPDERTGDGGETRRPNRALLFLRRKR